MDKKIIVGVIAVLSLILVILLITDNKSDFSYVNDTGYINNQMNLNNSYENNDWDILGTEDVELEEEMSYEFTEPGTYTLSGEINDTGVLVDSTGDVKLILDNAKINSIDGPGIVILSADSVVIELKEGTTNYVSDSEEYINEKYVGSIYSESNLTFEGKGSLEVTGNYKDGIVSNKNLKFNGGTYNIKSINEGIVGKDSINVVDGNFNIECGSNGFKSSNDEDASKGFINIDNGKFIINSGKDGMCAETKLHINNGDISIKTSDGSDAKDSAIYKAFYGGNDYDSESSKGLNAKDNLVIKNGTISIDSKDDAIYSNNNIGILDGKITINSGDDGIHADKDFAIDGGSIIIKQSYEGIDAASITINGGDISICSNDDGLNISGGKDLSSMSGRPGQNYSTFSYGTLNINNGKVYINSLGDGLDANGNIRINGGEIYIDGPISNGNSAIDYDGKFDITGGLIIAVSGDEMVQNIFSSSGYGVVMFNLDNSYNGKISLVSSSGSEIISYSPSKKYSNVAISTASINKDEEYTLKIDGMVIETIKIGSVDSSNTNVETNSLEENDADKKELYQ